MSSRINYALQTVRFGAKNSGDTAPILRGVQSVGASSTTNLENFSVFGSTKAEAIVQDVDMEVTIENALGDWGTAGVGFGSSHDVTIVYTYTDPSSGTTSYHQVQLADAICTGYSVQMGTDGPATESITLQNAGTVVFSGGASTNPANQDPDICNPVTRPDFTEAKTRLIQDYCGPSENIGSFSALGLLTSFSMSWDAGIEKVNVLGQSLPYGKFLTFPIEVSTEIESHVAQYAVSPNTQTTVVNAQGKTVFRKDRYDIFADLGHSCRFGTSKAVLASSSIAGGEVGGGNVTGSDSFTSYSSFFYPSSEGDSSYS